jgi:predicted DNA-binding mobile mystery protein A
LQGDGECVPRRASDRFRLCGVGKADRITLGQLRKLADGLDCELVYALVPRRPLTDVVQERARAIAMEEVGSVAHTMGLEDQRPGGERLRKQVERRTDELLRGRWSNLWR